MDKKINENEKSLEKIKQDSLAKRFFTNIKKRWLISRLYTLLLIVILIAIFVGINFGIRKLDITPIDCTTSKDYSLTDESKERVSKVEKEVNIYFVGWDESHKDYELAKQYSKVNSKLKVELVNATENKELADKYDVSNEDMAIIVECGETYRKLYYNTDIISYNENYQTVDLAEQKITSAILNVTSGNIPKVYYLTGYTSYSFERGLAGFAQYLNDEVLTYENLNILNTGKVPDDCNTLIIMTPEKDFDKTTTDAIKEYVKKGGNILWLNGAYSSKLNLTNVNSVLAEFGVNSFDAGVVYETNPKNTILGYQICFLPDVQDTEATRDVYKSAGVTFLYATKININNEKLEELKVEKRDLILSSNTSYFTTDLTGSSREKGEQGGFVLGAEMTKTIDENTKSKLIIYGNDAFITDSPITDGAGNNSYMIYLFNNADLGLNSIAYLTNNDQDITIRKSYSDSKTDFTPTDAQKTIIMIIIFAIPVLIIITGLVIWHRRKRRQ